MAAPDRNRSLAKKMFQPRYQPHKNGVSYLIDVYMAMSPQFLKQTKKAKFSSFIIK